jgi:hypothetical protein
MLPVATLPVIEKCLQVFKEAISNILDFTYILKARTNLKWHQSKQNTQLCSLAAAKYIYILL